MSSKMIDSVTLVFIAISLLAIMGIVMHRMSHARAQRVFDIERQDVFVARTAAGLEIFMPSGQRVMHNVTVIANKDYRTTLTQLGIGVTAIPRSSLVNTTGQVLPGGVPVTRAHLSWQGTGGGYSSEWRWK